MKGGNHRARLTRTAYSSPIPPISPTKALSSIQDTPYFRMRLDPLCYQRLQTVPLLSNSPKWKLFAVLFFLVSNEISRLILHLEQFLISSIWFHLKIWDWFFVSLFIHLHFHNFNFQFHLMSLEFYAGKFSVWNVNNFSGPQGDIYVLSDGKYFFTFLFGQNIKLASIFSNIITWG